MREEARFGRGLAVVGGEEGLARVAEGAEGAEVELREAVWVFFCGRGDLWGAAVDGWGACAHGGWAVVEVAARRGAACVVGGYGEGFVLGVVLGLRLGILVQCHGSSRADHAGGDSARLVTEDEARDDVEEPDDNG